MAPDVQNIMQRYDRIRQRYAKQEVRNSQVAAVRRGEVSSVAPDLFPEYGPWQEPIVANMIDIAARDITDMVAPLPSFNCTSSTMTSERQRERATEKTKIALGYVTTSDLQVQMWNGADWLVTFANLPFRVEVDYERQTPVIRALNPIGSYTEFDRYGRVRSFFQRMTYTRDELAAKFPELAHKIVKRNGLYGSSTVDVVFYHDKDWDVAILAGGDPLVLEKVPNPIGKPMVVVAQRPGATDIPRGQFDDVIFIQLAKARFAMLALQAADDSVNSPLIVPNDVPEVPFGPGATIRTSSPESIRRAPIDIPAAAFAEQAQLDREMQLGSRFPQARTGQVQGSIVTGKGVEALMGGYDAQVRSYQAILARALQQTVSLCFEVDEVVFGDIKKSLRGVANGTPYTIEYTPKKSIAGDYSVDVTYGLMAGLDPNRWLVFALQARAEKMFSRDFMRRELPVDIDVEDEARRIDIEDLEEAAKQALMGYAQSIPSLASNGQDPAGPIAALSKVIEGRRRGRPLADLIVEAFTPEPEPPAPQMAPEMGGEPQIDPATGMPVQGDPAASVPPGLGPTGLMSGVAPGQQGMLPGGRPDLNTMLAGLDSRGNANLTAGISRRIAV
jgi:hypothetical protein